MKKAKGDVWLTLVVSLAFFPTFASASSWERPWGATSALLGLGVASHFVPQQNAGSAWKNPIDTAARSALRGSEDESRIESEVYSDVSLTLALTVPLSNALLSSYQPEETRLSRSDREWVGFTTAQALGVNWIITETLKRVTARVRPRASCGGGESWSCSPGNPAESVRSFPSGHTSFAFTAAGLACMQAATISGNELPLSGAWVCPTTLGLAAVTAFFRMRADAHWLTDTLAGAAIGFLSGYSIAPALTGNRPSVAGGTNSVYAAQAPSALFLTEISF